MPDTDLGGLFLGPGEGIAMKNPVGGAITFKLTGEQTSGALAALETVAAPGEGPPLHLHANEDEVLWALDGRFRFRLGDELRDAPAGSLAFIPRGVVHTWQNVSDQPARLLALVMPAGFEQFFQRFARLPQGASPADEFRRLGSELGMTVVGPPLRESNPL